MVSAEWLCEELRAKGRRLTPQRRAIIQALVEDEWHPTADRIFTRVNHTMPGLSPATVYNTLRELVEIGALLELDLGLGERYYDLTTTTHAHLVCLECGCVEDVSFDCQALALPPEQIHGFQVQECNVVFRGCCPRCARRGRG